VGKDYDGNEKITGSQQHTESWQGFTGGWALTLVALPFGEESVAADLPASACLLLENRALSTKNRTLRNSYPMKRALKM
jgi:hypothetical protein